MRLILAATIIFLTLLSCAQADTVLKKIDIADIDIDLPSEILIEKGWTQYISFSLNNTGQTNIYQISAYFIGSPSTWFMMDSYKIGSLPMGKETELLAKILVPLDARNGEYDFALRVDSNEISYEKDFTVRVFGTRDEMLSYQIEKLQRDLDDIVNRTKSAEERGLNLTFANELIYEIRSGIIMAREDVQNEMYSQVTESIRDIEKLLIKAEYEVDNPQETLKEETASDFSLPVAEILTYAPLVLAAAACVSIAFLARKNKISNAVRLPNLKVREAIVESPRFLQLDAEIGKLSESLRLLGEEFSQGIITKESYDDLRIKYQEKMFELENEKRKEKK